MKTANLIAHVLIIIGGLNWGLVGIFDWNLVAAIFGVDSWFTNLIYIVVGIAALWSIYTIYPLKRGTEVMQHDKHHTAARR